MQKVLPVFKHRLDQLPKAIPKCAINLATEGKVFTL